MDQISFSSASEMLRNSSVLRERLPESVISDAVFFVYRPGEEIVKTGKDPKYLFLMIEGEMELLGFDGDVLNVRATERTILAGIPVDRCRHLLLEDTVFLRRLCLEISRKEREKIFSIARTQGYPIRNRLAEFILETSEDGRYHIRKVDASESLGTSYRRIQQVMSAFVNEGYLIREGTGYRINDRKALEVLASELTFR